MNPFSYMSSRDAMATTIKFLESTPTPHHLYIVRVLPLLPLHAARVPCFCVVFPMMALQQLRNVKIYIVTK